MLLQVRLVRIGLCNAIIFSNCQIIDYLRIPIDWFARFTSIFFIFILSKIRNQ